MSFSIKKKNGVFNSSESEITKKISTKKKTKKKLFFSSKVMINNACYLQNVKPVQDQTNSDFVLFPLDLQQQLAYYILPNLRRLRLTLQNV